MIILNGSLFVDGKEHYFEDFTIEIEDELDLFDLFEDDFDCEDDCEFCDCDESEEDEDMTYAEFKEEMDDLFEFYSELLSEEELCPDCAKLILLNFLDDWLDIGE